VIVAPSPSLAVTTAGGAALSFWIKLPAGSSGTVAAIGDPAAPALLASVSGGGVVNRLRPVSAAAKALSRLIEAFAGLYMRRIGSQLEEQLARRDDVRRQAWRADVMITVDERGIIRSAEIAGGLDP
jgi:hypothetical protein